MIECFHNSANIVAPELLMLQVTSLPLQKADSRCTFCFFARWWFQCMSTINSIISSHVSQIKLPWLQRQLACHQWHEWPQLHLLAEYKLNLFYTNRAYFCIPEGAVWGIRRTSSDIKRQNVWRLNSVHVAHWQGVLHIFKLKWAAFLQEKNKNSSTQICNSLSFNGWMDGGMLTNDSQKFESRFLPEISTTKIFSLTPSDTFTHSLCLCSGQCNGRWICCCLLMHTADKLSLSLIGERDNSMICEKDAMGRGWLEKGTRDGGKLRKK